MVIEALTVVPYGPNSSLFAINCGFNVKVGKSRHFETLFTFNSWVRIKQVGSSIINSTVNGILRLTATIYRYFVISKLF